MKILWRPALSVMYLPHLSLQASYTYVGHLESQHPFYCSSHIQHISIKTTADYLI